MKTNNIKINIKKNHFLNCLLPLMIIISSKIVSVIFVRKSDKMNFNEEKLLSTLT